MNLPSNIAHTADFDIETFKFNIEDSSDYSHTLLSPEEQSYYQTLTHPERAKNFLAAHVLLHKVLIEHFKIPTPILKKLPSGKWTLTNSDLHISLSHSSKKIFIGISYLPIGVDVQKKQTHDFSKISKKIFHFNEIEFLEKTHFNEACSLFSLKESFGKAHGVGLTHSQEIDFSKYIRKNYKYLSFITDKMSISLENTDEYVYTTCVLLKN